MRQQRLAVTNRSQASAAVVAHWIARRHLYRVHLQRQMFGLPTISQDQLNTVKRTGSCWLIIMNV